MEVTVIDARDLSEAWFLCLRKAITHGYEYKIDRGSYAGQRRKELGLIVVNIKNPSTRPLIPDVPQGVPPPRTMEYVESYLPYLMTSHRAEGEQYTYGQYLEKQIPEVIKMYKEQGPNTNQAYMTVGDEKSIFLSDPPASGASIPGCEIINCTLWFISGPGTYGRDFPLTWQRFSY